MENYKKTDTRAVECPELQIDGPHIKVSANGRVKDYLAVYEKFKDETVVISGIGMAVNKTVTLAELIKKNYNVPLEPLIFDVAEVDTWTSVKGDLDPLQVTRHLPAIRFKKS